MTALNRMQEKRALIDGAAAQQAGLPPLAPRDIGQFKSHWLAGWDSAARLAPGAGGNQQSARKR